MIDRIEALGHALASLGYSFEDDGARLRVDAPTGSTATVQTSGTSYRCTFTLLADVRASAAWAEWTAKLGRAVAAAWVGVEHLPEREPVAVCEVVEPEPAPEPPPLEHAYSIGPRVDSAFEVSADETSRGRFRVVTGWQRPIPWSGRGWDGGLPEYVEGPTVHWHAWGESTAWLCFGAAKGWAMLDKSVDRDDRAARPVETILLRAAEGEALPSGIVALDLRGLPASTVHALVTALVSRVRSSDWPQRGVICLCDEQAAAWVARTIELDVSD